MWDDPGASISEEIKVAPGEWDSPVSCNSTGLNELPSSPHYMSWFINRTFFFFFFLVLQF